MMNDKNKLSRLLPWYANGTLVGKERAAIDNCLLKSVKMKRDSKDIDIIRSIVKNEPIHYPSASLKDRIIERIDKGQTVRKYKLKPADFFGSLIIWVSLFIILWLVFQPGVTIQWYLPIDSKSETINIYRKTISSHNFKIIDQISTVNVPVQIILNDPVLIPGQNYIYRIDAYDTSGDLVYQNLVSASTSKIIVNQIILILSSISLTLAIYILVKLYTKCGIIYMKTNGLIKNN
ncbi:MAG TPA: hypothetical protein G4N95_03595 [Anaerolineae bacterium]|nr:hypothetical protein [Anaerolineae bacterium]